MLLRAPAGPSQQSCDFASVPAGADAGRGNASKFWDEVGPAVRPALHCSPLLWCHGRCCDLPDPALLTSQPQFKPYKRENKRTRARDASTASYASSMDDSDAGAGAGGTSDGAATQAAVGGAAGAAWEGMPTSGTVVEYPLTQRERDELQDGRTHGVALLVGRNCDRGDAAQLPPHMLDLCEVEPLRQEEAGATR